MQSVKCIFFTLYIYIYIIFVLKPLILGVSQKIHLHLPSFEAHETLASTQRDVALLRAEQPRWRENAELSKRRDLNQGTTECNPNSVPMVFMVFFTNSWGL